MARQRHLVTIALWPFGLALTSWYYMWRTTPLHRREVEGTPDHDSPPRIPEGVPVEGLLLPAYGVGPMFHRRFRTRITGTDTTPEELLELLRVDLDRAAPSEFARFVKVRGDANDLRVGDEFVVRMPGPWNGPVRVVEVTPSSFRLATLEHHLEAGQIDFRLRSPGPGQVEFTIESWARSGDRLSKLLYQNLRMAKEVQLHMWTSFLERVVRLVGGRMDGGIDIETRHFDVDGAGGRPLQDPAARRVLDDLHEKALNFELDDRASFTAERGWKVDDYRQSLPGEPPGDPVPDGSWDVACRLLRDYEFADPAIVRAVYHHDRPLEERDILLEARWHGLRFRFGVRVGGVTDETRWVGGRSLRVWGWNYQTLQGHLEMGQIDYEVWKWVDTGEVEFRICTFSRRAPIANPVVRLGFRLFGRREQVRFAQRACERIARLTAAALAADDDVERASEHLLVRPALDHSR